MVMLSSTTIVRPGCVRDSDSGKYGSTNNTGPSTFVVRLSNHISSRGMILLFIWMSQFDLDPEDRIGSTSPVSEGIEVTQQSKVPQHLQMKERMRIWSGSLGELQLTYFSFYFYQIYEMSTVVVITYTTSNDLQTTKSKELLLQRLVPTLGSRSCYQL